MSVFEVDDLRRLVFSFLRKTAKIQCEICKAVCVWDIKVVGQYVSTGHIKSQHFCTDCYRHENNRPGCAIV